MVAIATFGLSYLSGEGTLIVLGGLGVAYFIVILIYLAYDLIASWRKGGESASRDVGVASFLLGTFFGSIFAALVAGESISGIQFQSFGWLQVNGLVGVVFFSFVCLTWLQQRRVSKFKRCPDCVEEVRKAANVCKFCGYRWATGGETSGRQPE